MKAGERKHDPNDLAGLAVAEQTAFSQGFAPMAFTLGTPITGVPHRPVQDVLGLVIDEMEAVVSLGGSPKLIAYARKWAATLRRLRDRGLPA